MSNSIGDRRGKGVKGVPERGEGILKKGLSPIWTMHK